MLDDRTTKARIRDAALHRFAEDGLAATARSIATEADVSPGLVMHHFGSMDRLRTACDEHVAALIRTRKSAVMEQGAGLDPMAALRESGYGHLVSYLARRLVDDSPAVADLVDELVQDAEGYFRRGAETGMLRDSPDARGRAVVLTLWSLGALVLHQHLRRLLGVDLTDPDLAGAEVADYARPALELLSTGIFTEAFAAQLDRAFADAAADADDDDDDDGDVAAAS